MRAGIHPLLKSKVYSSWEELEYLIAQIPVTTEKGDVFEQFSYFYLRYFCDYYQIVDLYAPKVPGRDIPRSIRVKIRLDRQDSGVDGVYIRTDGAIVAYQCKFRSGRTSPSGNELNDFWSEAEYADHRLVVSNAIALPSDAQKRKNNQSILVDRFSRLELTFFQYLYAECGGGIKVPIKAEKAKPKPFQVQIIESVLQGFQHVNRGKIIAACATGKTLISLWISEKLDAKVVLFLVPNLALVRQSIDRWALNAEIRFEYVAVCSDESISNNLEDNIAIKPSELDVPVTTDAKELSRFLSKKGVGKKVIFSTYHSVDVVAEAMRLAKSNPIDVIIFDEAHRTAGSKDSGLFSRALEDKFIPARKRLFMTATERIIKPWIKDRAEEANRLIFSMDDAEVYGPALHKLPFGTAIKEKIISDYKLLVAATDDKLLQGLVSQNQYVALSEAVHSNGGELTSQQLFKAILFLRAAAEGKAKKVISFHSSIREAKSFADLLRSFNANYLKQEFGLALEKGAFLHVNGSMPDATRQEMFREFEIADFGIITNVRCLTEGVDLPLIDGVLFADPKGSLIDIIQAVGRALRKPMNNESKTAYIMLPVFIGDSGKIEDERFESFHYVVQALRDQDETLAEWIDQINLGVVKGKGRGILRGCPKFEFHLPKQINFDDFSESLALRIAEVNSRPAGKPGLGSTLGKKQRTSDFKRIFQCMGDYNADVFKEKLVDPTIKLFKNIDKQLKRSDITLNNNNVSHTQRLGLICPVGPNIFRLTPIGILYKTSKISFEQLFRNQSLLYFVEDDDEVLFPYRFTLKLFHRVTFLNYVEFLYSIHSAQCGNEAEELHRAESMVQYMRAEYPNVMRTEGEDNQERIRLDLNARHSVGFSKENVWTDRTTAGNQFRYLVNHLQQFEDWFEYDKDKRRRLITMTEIGKINAAACLASTDEHLTKYKENYIKKFWIGSV